MAVITYSVPLTYLPGSAKLRRGSSFITQPLWARKWHILSGWSRSCISCSRVMSWYGKVKYLRQTDEKTEAHGQSASLHNDPHMKYDYCICPYHPYQLSQLKGGRKIWVGGMLPSKRMKMGITEYLLGVCGLTPKWQCRCSSLSISVSRQISRLNVEISPEFRIQTNNTDFILMSGVSSVQ